MRIRRRSAQKGDNNFACLRLLLAFLVLVSHSPELVDGNRSREILTRLFGTLSFGEVAVDGFFLISGFLITKSFEQSTSTILFFEKRLLRILPGFLVCSFFCVFGLAPLVGGLNVFTEQTLEQTFKLSAKLLPPNVAGSFAGLPYPLLNGSMWTIAYEFRCYCFAAAIGLVGAYAPPNRRLLALLVAACFLLLRYGRLGQIHYAREDLFGSLATSIRFYAAFGTGSLFYLIEDGVDFRPVSMGVAACLLFALMFVSSLAEPAFIILGGYLLFAFALGRPVGVLARINKAPDISYGLYLYAWPVQNSIIWFDREINPWMLVLETVVIAGCFGYLSWHLVERPAMEFTRRRFGAATSKASRT